MRLRRCAPRVARTVNHLRASQRSLNYGTGKNQLGNPDAETLEDYTVKALTYEMELYQRKSAERTVPWFLKNFPPQYFREIDRDLQKDHLRALTALTEAGLASYEEEEAQKLCELSAKGDVKGVKRVVNMGAHPNAGDYDGRTPLHLAASEGHLDVLKFLITVKGTNINVVDRWGGTPLADAMRHGHADSAKWIRSKGGLEEIPKGAIDSMSEEEEEVRDDKGMVELMLKSRTGRYVTFFKPHKKGSTGDFAICVAQLPLEQASDPLIRVKGFVTNDTALAVNVFEFGDYDEDYMDEADLDDMAKDVFKLANQLQNGENVEGIEWNEAFEEANLRKLLTGTTRTYMTNTPPERVLRHMKAVYDVTGTDSGKASIRLASELQDGRPGTDKTNQYWVTSVSSNVHAHSEMERVATYLGSRGLAIDRFHMDLVRDPETGIPKCLIRTLVEPQGRAITPEFTEQIMREMPRLKYLDDRILRWTASNDQISMNQAEICSSLGNLIFTCLSKQHPHMFTLGRIQKAMEEEENLTVVKRIADLWYRKFDPVDTISKADYEEEKKEVYQQIRLLTDQTSQHLLRKLVEATDASLRTNFFLPERRSLAIRVASELMVTDKDAAMPFGVFFAHGRGINGFQVRFRDIARGGLRIVPCQGFERFAQESMRHFDEVYGLAFAQQLKNKDIPEGGSKAVCMVNVSDRMPDSRDFLVRKAVRSFTDGLLDLITPDPEVKKNQVDYWGKDELLYLGPDENIIPEDINWVIERAAVRGMKYPNAFMSSKPEAGINHKVYGVTSEGVAVFLRVALQQQGFDVEKDNFSVKITGGPNGDVAGNMIKIFCRDYPGRAGIVGMCDHTGGVENESGLDMEELLRLHLEDLPISSYNEDKVGPGGQKYGVATPEELQLRNTLHNRLKADAFIPAGGRPNTININNYDKYFLDDGTPSAPLIVEAANIFTTPEARKEFGDRGISIVKDSSANKAGVCCSSYEIVASMLLSKEEFLGDKEDIVADVLEKLRNSARTEAELLFREYRSNPSYQLPYYSQAISGAINRATDAVVDAVTENFSLVPDDLRHRLLVDSLPKKLVDMAGDRLEELPHAYIVSMMGAQLGSKMVYNEGLDFIDSLDDRALTELAVNYVTQEDKLREVISAMGDSDIACKSDIMKILKAAGVQSVMKAGL